MSSTIVFDQTAQMQRVCGVNDRNVPYVELLLNGELFVHGNSITYKDVKMRQGSGDQLFVDLMNRLRDLAQREQEITEPEIFMEFQSLQNKSEESSQTNLNDKNDIIFVGGRSLS